MNFFERFLSVFKSGIDISGTWNGRCSYAEGILKLFESRSWRLMQNYSYVTATSSERSEYRTRNKEYQFLK